MEKKQQLHPDAILTKVQQDIRSCLVPAVCEAVVSFLLSRKARKLTYINYGMLREGLDISHDDTDKYAELLAATSYLTSNHLKLLVMHFQYMDDSMEQPIPLDDEYIAEAFKTGELGHPQTGMPVADYENKVFPYFVPTEVLRNLHGH